MKAHRALLVLASVVVLAGFLLPAATAQSGQCAPPNVSLGVPGGTFAPDETRTGTLSITNPNSFDGEAEVTLEAPAGWSALLGRSTVTVPAGNTTTVDVTVASPTEGSGVSRGDVVATVTLTCNVGVLGDPSTGTVESVQTVQVAEEGLPWAAVLLAGVALVGGTAGAVALRSRRLAVELACHRPLLPVAPGGNVSFPIAVANRRSEPDTVQLRVLDVPDGWRAFVPVPEVELGPREDREIALVVRAPEDAGSGEQVTLTVEAVPVRGERGHRIAVGAEVDPDAPDAPEREAAP